MANDIYNEIYFEGDEKDITRLLNDLKTIHENFNYFSNSGNWGGVFCRFGFGFDTYTKTKLHLSITTQHEYISDEFLIPFAKQYNLLVDLKYSDESDWHKTVYETNILEEQINDIRYKNISKLLE